ncbi:MAG: hypothetical protein IPM06_19600 [Rhizobiales bacterium]|nr:hypothetical protein [Hyphomicrobiales bacterium]
MTTSLMTQGAKLTETQLAVLAEMDSEGNSWGDFIPDRIKFGSGGLMAFQTGDGQVMPSPIKAVVIVAQRCRAFWPSKDTAGMPPLCASADGFAGTFDIGSAQVKDALTLEHRHPALSTVDPDAAVGPWDCASCPLAQYGSGANGAQACKSLRRLVILPEGWSAPALLTLPPTSVKVWDAFASGRKSRQRAYFDGYAFLGLTQDTNKSGIKYAKLTVGAGDALTEAQLADVIVARHQYAELVRSMGLVADDYDTSPVVDGAPADDPTLPPF